MLSEPMVIALIGAAVGVGGSSGFWLYLQKRFEKNSATTRLLMGLAYDKIITVGMGYIHRGWVTKDEWEEYEKYLVQPYKEMGGNGVADRIATDVKALPFRTVQFAEITIKE